ncbi:hypothetical protein P8452_17338 [Trifolium repens]|nr:hypothetical protein P8452_17338 [Trifolium repens]
MIFVFNAVCGGISSTLGSLLLERCLLVIVLGDKLEDLKSFDEDVDAKQCMILPVHFETLGFIWGIHRADFNLLWP